MAEQVATACGLCAARRLAQLHLGAPQPLFGVERCCGHTHMHMRLNRFTLRGQHKVGTQWRLYCLVHNIEKLAGCGLRK
ncbi:MAG: transposase [Acidovorax sp.]